MTRYARRYRKIRRALSHLELLRLSDDDAPLTFGPELIEAPPSNRILGVYGDQGLLLALERYGILHILRDHGLRDISLSLRREDDQHIINVLARAPEVAPDAAPATIIEVVLRRDAMRPLNPQPPLRDTYDVLTIDWVCLQNPFERFTLSRPRLPGQIAPGLGIGERVMELFHQMMARLRLDAVVVVAGYLHNAILYATEWPFFDPACMGRLRALKRDLMQTHRLSLPQASWAVEWGLVRDRDGAVFQWRGEAQLKPRARSLVTHLSSDAHAEEVEAASRRAYFHLEEETFRETWRAQLDALLAPPIDAP